MATTLATAYFQLVPSMGGNESRMRSQINQFATGAGKEGGQRLGKGMTDGAASAMSNTGWSQRLVSTMNAVGQRLGSTTGTGIGASLSRGLGSFLTNARVQGMMIPMVNSMQRVATVAKQALGTGFQTAASIGATALTGLVALVTKALPEGIARADTLNRFPKMMQNMGFSAEEASGSIKKIADHLDGLPTTTDEVAQTVQRLTPIISGGIGEATDVALALNDAMLAGSGSSVLAAQGLEQYAQMLAVGKPDMMAWRSMMRAMPQQLDQIARALLGPTANSMELYEAMRDGNVTFDEFNKALVELDKNGAEGLASFAEQAKTSVRGIDTSMQLMVTRMGRAIGDFLGKVGVDRIASAMDRLSSSYRNWGNIIGDAFVNPVNKASKAVGGWFLAFSHGVTLIDLGVAKVMTSGNKLATVFTAINRVGGGLITKALSWVSLLSSMWSSSERFRGAVKDLGKALGEMFSSAGGGTAIWETLNDIWSTAAGILGDTMALAIKTVLIPALQLLNVILKQVSNAFQALDGSSNPLAGITKNALALGVAFMTLSKSPLGPAMKALGWAMQPLKGLFLATAGGAASASTATAAAGGAAATATWKSKLFQVALKGLGFVARGITSPIGLAITAVTALVAVFKNWDTITRWGENLRQGIANVAANVTGWLADVTTRIREWAEELPEKALNVGSKIADKVSSWATDVANGIPTFFQNATDAIRSWAHDDAPEGIRNAEGEFTSATNVALNGVPNAIKENLETAWTNVKTGLGKCVDAFANFGSEVSPAIFDAMEKIGTAIGDWVLSFDWVTALGDISGAIWTWFSSNVSNALRNGGKLIDWVDDVLFHGTSDDEISFGISDHLKSCFRKAVDKMGDVWQNLKDWWNGIDWAKVVEDAPSKIQEAVETVISDAISGMKDMGDAASELGLKISMLINDAIAWAINKFKEDPAIGQKIVMGILSAIATASLATSVGLLEIGRSITNGIIDGIMHGLGFENFSVDGMFAGLGQAFANIGTWLDEHVWQPISNWFSQWNWNTLFSAAPSSDSDSMWGTIWSWLTAPLSWLNEHIWQPCASWFTSWDWTSMFSGTPSSSSDSMWGTIWSWLTAPLSWLNEHIWQPCASWFTSWDWTGIFSSTPSSSSDSMWGTIWSWLTAPLAWLNEHIWQPICDWFTSWDWTGIFSSAPSSDSDSMWGTIWSWFTAPITWLTEHIWQPISDWFSDWSWDDLWTAVPALAGPGALLLGVFGWVVNGDFGSWLNEHIWQPVSNWFSGWDWGGIFSSTPSYDTGSMWGTIWSWFTGIGTWLDEHIWQPLTSWFTGWNWTGIFDGAPSYDTGSMWNTIWSWFTGIGTWLDEHIWQPVRDWFSGWSWDSLWAAVPMLAGPGGLLAGVFAGILGGDFGSWLDEHIWTPIKNWFSSFSFQGLWDSVPKTDVGSALKALFPWVSGIANWLTTNIWQPIQSWFQNQDWSNLGNSMKDGIGGAWDELKNRTGSAWDGIKNKVGEAWNNITGSSQTGAANTKTATTSNTSSMQTTTQGYWLTLARYIARTWSQIVNTAVTQVRAMASYVQNGMSMMARQAQSLISQMVRTITQRFREMATQANQVVRQLAQNAMNAFNTMLRGCGQAVRSLLSAVISGFSQMNAYIAMSVRVIPAIVQGALSGVGAIGYNAGIAVGNGFVRGVSATFGSVRATLGNLTAMIPHWKGPYEVDKVLLKPNGELIIQSLIAGFEAGIPYLRELLEGLTQDIPLMVDPEGVGAVQLYDSSSVEGVEALGGPRVTIVNNNPREKSDADIRAEVSDGLRLAGMLA